MAALSPGNRVTINCFIHRYTNIDHGGKGGKALEFNSWSQVLAALITLGKSFARKTRSKGMERYGCRDKARGYDH